LNAKIVHTQTEDNVTLAGALFSTTANAPSNVSALLFFHGDGGNFYSPLYLKMGEMLSQQGITFLSANRRGHDTISSTGNPDVKGGYAFESVAQSPLDIQAWINFLANKGHRAIAVGGHSGGAVRAIYAQSTSQFSNVKALIPVSPGEYNHEEIIELHGKEFKEAFSLAELSIAKGNPEHLLQPGLPWGSTWTATSFVDCFNKDDRYQVSHHAMTIQIPTLFIFGELETKTGDKQELPVCGLARRTIEEKIGSYSPHLSLKIIESANHGYTGKETDLYDTIHGFLKSV
tara:strand:+ start:4329 stop:5192 length:864 start_codon:yes stop_codon:yes gene_type:complete